MHMFSRYSDAFFFRERIDWDAEISSLDSGEVCMFFWMLLILLMLQYIQCIQWRCKTQNTSNLIGLICSVFKSTETISYWGPKTWTLVPENIKQSQSLLEFNVKIKSWKAGRYAHVACVKHVLLKICTADRFSFSINIKLRGLPYERKYFIFEWIVICIFLLNYNRLQLLKRF